MNHLIVVGGTKGLGKAFVESAGPAYKHVTVLARSAPERPAANIHFISADATKQTALIAGLEQAVANNGRVDHVVFFQQYRGKENAWDNKIACVLTATRNALEYLAPHFSIEGDKSVVFLTSTASRLAAEEQDEGYHASKTALLGLCRYYAVKFGALGIRVNCVSPGTVLKEATKHHFLDNAELHTLFKQIIPLRRMGTEHEVGSVIKFLLSPAASFVTGQEIVVDGGASLRSQESLARSLFDAAKIRG